MRGHVEVVPVRRNRERERVEHLASRRAACRAVGDAARSARLLGQLAVAAVAVEDDNGTGGVGGGVDVAAVGADHDCARQREPRGRARLGRALAAARSGHAARPAGLLRERPRRRITVEDRDRRGAVVRDVGVSSVGRERHRTRIVGTPERPTRRVAVVGFQASRRSRQLDQPAGRHRRSRQRCEHRDHQRGCARPAPAPGHCRVSLTRIRALLCLSFSAARQRQPGGVQPAAQEATLVELPF